MKAGAVTMVSLFAVSLAVNLAVVLLLAMPFNWLWDYALAPVFSVPRLDYPHSAGLLGLITIIRLALHGVEFSATLRDQERPLF